MLILTEERDQGKICSSKKANNYHYLALSVDQPMDTEQWAVGVAVTVKLFPIAYTTANSEGQHSAVF
jgi:hypothetical protein